MSVSEGLRIISVAKALAAFQNDSNISAYFGVTRLVVGQYRTVSFHRYEAKQKKGSSGENSSHSLHIRLLIFRR